MFVECTALFMKRGPVPNQRYTIPIGVADIKRAGDDVTIITYGRQVADALKAAETLAEDGVSAEVIDLRTVAPLDMDTVLTSVARTNRAARGARGRADVWARGARSRRGSTRSCTAS